MELWIRSQDRTILRKVDTIGIVEGRDFWSIDENLTVSFGKYKTKERALEVLDEIQNIFSLKIENKSYEETDLILKAKMLDSCYQMPKE